MDRLRRRQPGELLFTFERGSDRYRCELRDHGAWGTDARFPKNGAFMLSRRDRARPFTREAAQRDALQLAAIVDSSDDAIVSKDLDGIVTSWNAAAERMFGYPASEMVGQSIRTIIPADRQQEEDTVLARVSAAGSGSTISKQSAGAKTGR